MPSVKAKAPVDLVIFDCDGVLVDSEIIAAAALSTALAESDVNIGATEPAKARCPNPDGDPIFLFPPSLDGYESSVDTGLAGTLHPPPLPHGHLFRPPTGVQSRNGTHFRS